MFECLMRWEIFSGWRVIFVSVCGRGVHVCVSASWCVHMLFVNVNAQAAPSWVLTDKDLMRAASWRNLTQPPTASFSVLPYYQLTATPSHSISLATKNSVMGHYTGPLTVSQLSTMWCFQGVIAVLSQGVSSMQTVFHCQQDFTQLNSIKFNSIKFN